jgi:tetratricopeptide (TPR) repeat protein
MLDRAFSHYRITSILGEGGMGSVYLADDTVLDRQVAIKFPATAGDTKELQVRLLREARAASALSHPNIAAVFDYGELDGRPYVVLEYVRGRTLSALLENGPLPCAEAVRITTQVLSALGQAHRQGIVHRDIKPSNIALNERDEVKVLDFGLARRVAPLVASTGETLQTASLDVSLCGTPAYMAPEQARDSAVDGRADIFSLGVVLYECLTGVRVFQGATLMDTLTRLLGEQPKPPSELNPEIPASLDRVVMKALSKERADRYGAAEDMLSDLSVVDSQDDAPAPELFTRRLAGQPRWSGRWPIAIVALVLAAGPALWFWQGPDPYQPGAEALRWYQEGVNAMRDGTYHKAAQALQQAVRTDPKFTLAHAALAEAWNELDYSDRAREEMLSVMPPGETAPRMTTWESLQVQAIGRVLVRDYEGAIAKYQELMRNLPHAERPAVLVHLGRVYEKADNLDAALESYLAAAGEQPHFAAAFLGAGVVHRRKREPAKAEEALNRAESLFRSLSNIEGTTEVLYQRSVLANQAGRFEEARALLDQALATARSVGSQQQVISALLQLSSVCYQQGLTDEARRTAEEALQLARRHGLDDLTARSLLELGTVAQIRGESAEAETWFSEALEAALHFGGRRTEARARFSLASVRVDMGEVDAALKDAEQALLFYEQGGYRREASACSLVVMRARMKQGSYDQVLGQAQVQLQEARSNDQPTASYLLEMIGGIAQEQERYREAVSHYAESVTISRAIGDVVGERWSLAGQGDAWWRLGRYDEARARFEEAARLATAGKDATLLAWIDLWQAEMLLSEGKTDQARARARRAAELAGRNREILADSTRVMALAELRSGQTGAAVSLSKRALELAGSAGLARATLHAQLAHAQALLAEGSAEAALEVAKAAWTNATRARQRESEWRACLLTAGAARRLPSPDLMAETESSSEKLFAQLWQSLTPQDHASYFARPDLRQIAAAARSGELRVGSHPLGE